MFRKVNSWLHLWLGLASGIVVLIVCITGCIWVFNEEITALTEPKTNIPKQESSVLKPSQLIKIANSQFPGMKVSYATYQQGRTIDIGLGERKKGGATLKLNPYTGEVVDKIEVKKGDFDFFRFILNGHRALWLPFEIGRKIVNYSTLIFVVLLITGLIWWWPKKWNKTTRAKSFKIKWGASFKRVNLDLHNVLGFYSLLFLLCIALTGMVWGIEWYSKGLYWVTTGGQTLPERGKLSSDSVQANLHFKPEQAIDIAFKQVLNKHPKAEGFYYSFPDTAKPKSVISVTVYPDKGQFYNSRSYKFDQHTLKALNSSDVYDISFDEASSGQKLRKMNYDIHVGSILGFPGKVLAFLAALIGASLPVTGFMVWWGRKFGKNKKEKKSRNTTTNTPEKSVGTAELPKVKLRRPMPVLQSNALQK
ncbi:PepSY-associated TM helix domain-containing protein [Desertivirga arenae]|uniref:PepSY-associated TM helix domain-containing protein n=1 Tax=Desertivirga arenae TaxID=2810309 RepID=UPI001A961FC5|nr:PepSY-associated TM helix domain-containing protein [Pedobacter sp. SYSU D00823]